jgi:hypothetical protein
VVEVEKRDGGRSGKLTKVAGGAGEAAGKVTRHGEERGAGWASCAEDFWGPLEGEDR